MKISRLLLLFLLLGLHTGLHAETGTERVHAASSMDWPGGRFILELSYLAEDGEALSAESRQHALNMIRREIPSRFLAEISGLNIDSRHTIHNRIQESPFLTESLLDMSLRGETVSASFNRDFSRFTQVIRYPLYPDIISLFISHTTASPQSAELEYVPTGPYSGIVIYAEGPLPVQGTRKSSELQPAFFPKVYNTDMETIFEVHMVDPERLRSWGPVQFIPVEEIHRAFSRVGEVPLYIHAAALFGIRTCDIVVSDRSGRQVRANDHILSLLKQGKIAVIYSSGTSSPPVKR